MGWLRYVYPQGFTEAWAKLEPLIGNAKSLAAWNDAPERTFEEVKAAFQKADL